MTSKNIWRESLDNLFLLVALGITALAAVLASVSLMRGPDPQTRMISADALTLIAMPAIIAIAVLEKRAIMIDIALVYALLSFLGVVTYARYLDKGL